MTPWHQLRLKIIITIRGPFTSKSAAMGGYGIDAVLLRTPAGLPLLPGTQVRGRLRDALLELAEADDRLADKVQMHWFGPDVNREKETIENGPRPCAWNVADFVAASKTFMPSRQPLTRIAIDAKSGSVQEGAMLVAETAAEPHEKIAFAGTIDLTEKTADDLLYAVDRLCRALAWIPSLGGFRTVGFGVVDSFQIDQIELRSLEKSAVDLSAEVNKKLQQLLGQPVKTSGVIPDEAVVTGETAAAYDCALTFDGPFCLVERRTNRNISESVEYVRGAVIKGAVAAQLLFVLGKQQGTNLGDLGQGTPWQELCAHPTRVRFLSAFPSAADTPERPFVAPLSLVKGLADEECRDAALCPKPFVFCAGGKLNAPRFDIDWKDRRTPEVNSGWKKPTKELRLHTAIDARYRRAKAEHLFGQKLIRPEETVWRGVIDLNRVPEQDRPKVFAQLKAFLVFARLRIGKTKACATLAAGSAQGEVKCPPAEGEWVIVLQTPALLVDPRTLHEEWTTSESDPLEALYKKMWSEFSLNQLELVRFFTDQELQGGFLGRKRSKQAAYNPYLVTRAGSVFVVKASRSEAQAQATVERFRREGLPLPQWALELYGTEFSTNPFLPEDGFGEVLVNHEMHKRLKPKDGEVEYL